MQLLLREKKGNTWKCHHIIIMTNTLTLRGTCQAHVLDFPTVGGAEGDWNTWECATPPRKVAVDKRNLKMETKFTVASLKTLEEQQV